MTWRESSVRPYAAGAVAAAAAVTGGAVVAAIATPSVQMLSDMVGWRRRRCSDMSDLETL